MTTATINHADYSNLPSFARVCEQAFRGVAVLPNQEVMAACLRGAGKRLKPVGVAVLADKESCTAYRVGGEFGELVVIDATSGEFQVFNLGASDEDSEREVAAVLAMLTTARD